MIASIFLFFALATSIMAVTRILNGLVRVHAKIVHGKTDSNELMSLWFVILAPSYFWAMFYAYITTP